MGMKDSMMNNMMDKMSAEEKKEMMEKMMENFFSTMTDEEKSSMMSGMMEKMFSGGKGPFSMMNMMSGQRHGSKHSPMDMCQKMMNHLSETRVTAQYATPELRSLFEEWAGQLENEILQSVEKNGSVDLKKLCDEFHLKEESIQYILSNLAKKGKIKYST